MENITLAALDFLTVYFCCPSRLGSKMFSNIKSRSSQSCRFFLHTSPIFNTKHLPTEPISKTKTILSKLLRKSVILDKSQHRLIYSLPYIPYIAGYLKSKTSVSVVCFSILPVLYYYTESYVLPFVTAVSATTYFAMGTVVSKFSANLVGKMYVNKENEITEVIMSSLDEFGRRIDRIHKVEDLINVDYPTKFSKSLGFIAIGIENSDIYYKINTKYCKFVDESACDCVFGFAWKSVTNETSETENKETQKEEDIKKILPEK